MSVTQVFSPCASPEERPSERPIAPLSLTKPAGRPEMEKDRILSFEGGCTRPGNLPAILRWPDGRCMGVRRLKKEGCLVLGRAGFVVMTTTLNLDSLDMDMSELEVLRMHMHLMKCSARLDPG